MAVGPLADLRTGGVAVMLACWLDGHRVTSEAGPARLHKPDISGVLQANLRLLVPIKTHQGHTTTLLSGKWHLMIDYMTRSQSPYPPLLVS